MVGGMMVAIARMSANGSLIRNGAVGIRTSKTQASDAAWEAGHKAAAPVMRGSGVVSLALGVALVISGFMWPGDVPSLTTVALFVVGYGAVLVGSVPIVIKANAAATRAHSTQGQSISSERR